MSVRKYIKYFIPILVTCVVVYQYAYNKGYANAISSTLNIPLSKEQKTLSTKSSPYDSLYEVSHVADGDTVDIEKEGIKVRVRLLGINSPESVAKDRKVECYGKESALYMKELVLGKKVSIKLDSLKPEKDDYGRVLAYLWREDGLFINQNMIESGHAYEYTYKSEKYKFQSEFKIGQKLAENGWGIEPKKE